MSCVTCATKTKDQRYEQALKDATDHAQQNKIPVAIYQEAGEWKYCNAFEAYAAGYPVIQVVSIHPSATPE